MDFLVAKNLIVELPSPALKTFTNTITGLSHLRKDSGLINLAE